MNKIVQRCFKFEYFKKIEIFFTFENSYLVCGNLLLRYYRSYVYILYFITLSENVKGSAAV